MQMHINTAVDPGPFDDAPTDSDGDPADEDGDGDDGADNASREGDSDFDDFDDDDNTLDGGGVGKARSTHAGSRRRRQARGNATYGSDTEDPLVSTGQLNGLGVPDDPHLRSRLSLTAETLMLPSTLPHIPRGATWTNIVGGLVDRILTDCRPPPPAGGNEGGEPRPTTTSSGLHHLDDDWETARLAARCRATEGVLLETISTVRAAIGELDARYPPSSWVVRAQFFFFSRFFSFFFFHFLEIFPLNDFNLHLIYRVSLLPHRRWKARARAAALQPVRAMAARVAMRISSRS
jgi:hypothetical protein